MQNLEYCCAVEQPVEFHVNGGKLTTFMCTPENLHELALGHLTVRGYIESIRQVKDVRVDLAEFRIYATIDKLDVEEKYSVPEFILSGYSGVSSFSDNIYKLEGARSEHRVTMDEIFNLSKLLADAPIYNSTGGVHGAAILCGDRILIREDIGRHNAVDKCIGAAISEELDLENCVIATTGRISLDMLLKTASVKIPIVASFKYPSNLGVKLSELYDTTLIGRSATEKPIVYTGGRRIKAI